MDASRLFHLREVVAAGLVFVHRFRLRGKEPERIKMRADNRAGLHKCVDLVVRQSHGYLFMSYFTSPVDRKSTRLNSSHVAISYAVFCLKKKNGDRSV